jgi:ketosteroid isomerase-like protein
MSQPNVEALREGLEAFNSGDIERILAFTHRDFEGVVPPELSPEPDTYRGHDGIRRYFQSFQDAMDEICFHPERFWEVGDSVVVAMRLTARGRQTGIPVEQRFTQLWTMCEGKAMSVRTHTSLSDALEAVGLAE